jgi:hypothetical protein
MREDEWHGYFWLWRRLLSGEVVASVEMERLGLRVELEEDTDQGEE